MFAIAAMLVSLAISPGVAAASASAPPVSATSACIPKISIQGKEFEYLINVRVLGSNDCERPNWILQRVIKITFHHQLGSWRCHGSLYNSPPLICSLGPTEFVVRTINAYERTNVDCGTVPSESYDGDRFSYTVDVTFGSLGCARARTVAAQFGKKYYAPGGWQCNVPKRGPTLCIGPQGRELALHLHDDGPIPPKTLQCGQQKAEYAHVTLTALNIRAVGGAIPCVLASRVARGFVAGVSCGLGQACAFDVEQFAGTSGIWKCRPISDVTYGAYQQFACKGEFVGYVEFKLAQL